MIDMAQQKTCAGASGRGPWQDIETAPMDGSLIDILVGYIDEVNCGTRLPHAYWREDLQEWWFCASFREGAEPLRQAWPDHPPVTHWMPLPRPPVPAITEVPPDPRSRGWLGRMLQQRADRPYDPAADTSF